MEYRPILEGEKQLYQISATIRRTVLLYNTYCTNWWRITHAEMKEDELWSPRRGPFPAASDEYNTCTCNRKRSHLIEELVTWFKELSTHIIPFVANMLSTFWLLIYRHTNCFCIIFKLIIDFLKVMYSITHCRILGGSSVVMYNLTKRESSSGYCFQSLHFIIIVFFSNGLL